jgi:uncharacterized protein YjbJ (UPF0337 family)
MGAEDIAAGKLKRVRGAVNDAVGGATGNTRQQIKGKVQKVEGRVQEAYGKATTPRRDRAK